MSESTDQNDKKDKEVYEREVLLSEYKIHHEEIFKWNTFTNQLIVGYLALLSAVVTINVKGDSHIPWYVISMFVQYASLSLLFAVFQFKFNIVSHQKYIEERIREQFGGSNIDKRILDWESYFIKRRSESPWGIKWLTKPGINIAPYALILLAAFINVILLSRNKNTIDFWNGCFLSIIYVFIAVLIPIGLLICFLFGYRRLAK
ncbi:MAG: hypothetical protein ACOZB3_13155, partial [Calditrichota bacterium]